MANDLERTGDPNEYLSAAGRKSEMEASKKKLKNNQPLGMMDRIARGFLTGGRNTGGEDEASREFNRRSANARIKELSEYSDRHAEQNKLEASKMKRG